MTEPAAQPVSLARRLVTPEILIMAVTAAMLLVLYRRWLDAQLAAGHEANETMAGLFAEHLARMEARGDTFTPMASTNGGAKAQDVTVHVEPETGL